MTFSVNSLKAELTAQIEEKRKGIETARLEIVEIEKAIELLNTTSVDKESSKKPSSNILAIGDSGRSAIIAFCQSTGKGHPVNVSPIDKRGEFEWALSFEADTKKYIGYGNNITGGSALMKLEYIPVDTTPVI